jgi:pimeloyl-ACP methyl ester carboxylesterase
MKAAAIDQPTRTYLSLIHPRLFTSLILLDPVIQERSAEIDPSPNAPPNLAQLSTFRRDIWPSRQEAAAGFAKSAFYKAWDKRVLDKWNEYGLRETPTVLQPNSKSPQVTLATTAAQEVFTYLRPNYEGYGVNGKPVNRSTHADLDPSRPAQYPFYRNEAPQIYARLQEVRPSVLYIFGATSGVSLPETSAAKLVRTGTGVGGSGGAAEGRVKGETFEGVGHLIPMEAPEKTAASTAQWIGAEMVRFRDEMKVFEQWRAKSLREKQQIDEKWKKMIGGPPKRPSKI